MDYHIAMQIFTFEEVFWLAGLMPIMIAIGWIKNVLS